MKFFLMLIILLLSFTTFNSCIISKNNENEKILLTQDVLTEEGEKGKNMLYLRLIGLSLIVFTVAFIISASFYGKININFIYILFLLSTATLIIYTFKINTFIGVGSSIACLFVLAEFPSGENYVNPEIQKDVNTVESITFFTVLYVGFFVITLVQYLFGLSVGLV